MELEVDRRRAPLFLFLSRVLKIVVFSRREWQCSEQESHARQELLIVDPWRHQDESQHFLLIWRVSVDGLVVRYLWYDQRERKSARSISGEHEAQDLDWFRPSGE
jgi:hypothetical protein